MKLSLDWADYKSSKYAVENYHYSKCMPNGKLVRIGVWEDDDFKGVILFGRGANNNLLKPYGFKTTDGAELTRIALKQHNTPVTRLVSIAIKMLKKQSPNLKLIISFADGRQNHLGKIYQAGNWIYTGIAHTTPDYYVGSRFINKKRIGQKLKGRWIHQRTVGINIKGGKYTKEIASKFPQKSGGIRYRYLYPLDEDTRKKIIKLSLPYPHASVV